MHMSAAVILLMMFTVLESCETEESSSTVANQRKERCLGIQKKLVVGRIRKAFQI